MSTTLCQITAHYLAEQPQAALMRALQAALRRFLAVYVSHTPNLGWELSQVRLCVKQGSQTSAAELHAWLALPAQQRHAQLTRVLAAQAKVMCAEPVLQLTGANPANPERCITVYLPGQHGGSELMFEFPGDFCCLPPAAASGA